MLCTVVEYAHAIVLTEILVSLSLAAADRASMGSWRPRIPGFGDEGGGGSPCGALATSQPHGKDNGAARPLAAMRARASCHCAPYAPRIYRPCPARLHVAPTLAATPAPLLADQRRGRPLPCSRACAPVRPLPLARGSAACCRCCLCRCRCRCMPTTASRLCAHVLESDDVCLCILYV